MTSLFLLIFICSFEEELVLFFIIDIISITYYSLCSYVSSFFFLIFLSLSFFLFLFLFLMPGTAHARQDLYQWTILYLRPLPPFLATTDSFSASLVYLLVSVISVPSYFRWVSSTCFLSSIFFSLSVLISFAFASWSYFLLSWSFLHVFFFSWLFY